MAMHPLSLSLIIPAFNEEHRLPATLETASAYLSATPWDWEIRVVDDGSTDGTCRVVSDFSQREPRVVRQSEPHRGKGGALKAGLLGTARAYRLMCDADLSVPMHETPRFLPPRLTGVDVAIAADAGRPSGRSRDRASGQARVALG
jgi:dolichyl-phosphate beta-glucosyltransferase